MGEGVGLCTKTPKKSTRQFRDNNNPYQSRPTKTGETEGRKKRVGPLRVHLSHFTILKEGKEPQRHHYPCTQLS